MKAFLFSMLLLSSGASLAQTMEEYAAKFLPHERVNDYGHLLTRTEKNRLTQEMIELSEWGKLQWAICVIPEFGPHNPAELAHVMRQFWPFGNKKDAVLIVVGAKEKEVAVALGSSAQKIFGDHNANLFLAQQMAADFDRAQYYEALQKGVIALWSKLNNEPTRSGDRNYLPWVIGITFLVMLVPGIFMLRRGMRISKYAGRSMDEGYIDFTDYSDFE